MIRYLLLEGKAKINLSSTEKYSYNESLKAFIRVAGDHGWKI